jgi:hypothetical protein
MERFCSNSAKSYIGRNVNLHLKDGSVIVNVHLTAIRKAAGKNNNLLEYANGNRKSTRLPLRSVAYAELLNLSLIKNLA